MPTRDGAIQAVTYAARASATLVKNGDVQLAVVDDALRIVSVNDAWAEGVGDAGGVVGALLADFLPEPVLDQLGPRRRRTAQALALSPLDLEHQGVRWCEIGCKRLGRHFLIAAVDVTDSRTDRARVQMARQARDLLLAESGVEAWRFDPAEQVFVLSPELVTDYGIEPPRLAVDMFDSLRHPEDLVKERRLRARISRKAGHGEIEIRMRGFDERGWRHVRVCMLAGLQLPCGDYEVYGHTNAVSGIAKVRDEARANIEFLEIALSAAKAGVFDVDHVAKEFRCSPEFINIVGRPLTYVEGRDADWPELPPEDRAAMQAIQGRWGMPGYESVDVRGGRDGRWIRFYCKVSRDEAGIGLGAVGLVLDIDDAKRQELELAAAHQAAEAATRAKSSFLASVSHEIRTPMNGIVGVLHLIKSEPVSDEGQRLLDEALACSGMLSQLINDVLDFSKIEAGKLELAPSVTALSATLEGVAGLLKSEASAKGLFLRTTVDPEVGWAMIDGVRLRQCLFNLIGNAVKFTAAGGIEARMSRPSEGRLRVEIEDTGIGIGEEARSRLFQRFVQVDDAMTRSFSGTGLGLAISRSLARMMGGDVGFESQEGKGSTFWLEIDAPAAAEPVQGDHDGLELSLAGLSILLVDDNAMNRLVGGKIMEALGADLTLCESGGEAVELASIRPFDLIMMDVNMPVMDGLEATRRIRALPGERGQVPIIALTANVMAHQRLTYLAAGMNGVVPKPLSPAALLAEIGRLASGEEPQDISLSA